MTNSRREIVERAISFMKEDVALSDRKRLDIVLKRTKFIILGKETKMRVVDDQRIYTVPIMLEFKTEGDKVEVEELLKTVGWFPSLSTTGQWSAWTSSRRPGQRSGRWGTLRTPTTLR